MSLDKLPEHILLFIISFLKPKCKLDINYKGLMLCNKLYYTLLNSILYNCNILKLNDDLKFVLNNNKNYYCTCHNGVSKSTLDKLSSLLKNNNNQSFSSSKSEDESKYESKYELPSIIRTHNSKHFIHFDTLEQAEAFLNLKQIFRFKIRLSSRCCSGKGIGFYFI